jgi:uncharacterized protein (DUF427 family)
MKALWRGHVLADGDDLIEFGGYQYFPPSAVRTEWLVKAPKTESDHACPHGVQFYDVVIDGERHERAAWSYESPRPALARLTGRVGFWGEVELV